MALSMSSVVSFFGDEAGGKRRIQRGESHYKSGHIESYSLSQGILVGTCRANMRDKVYNVSVSTSNDSGMHVVVSLALQAFLHSTSLLGQHS